MIGGRRYTCTLYGKFRKLLQIIFSGIGFGGQNPSKYFQLSLRHSEFEILQCVDDVLCYALAY